MADWEEHLLENFFVSQSCQGTNYNRLCKNWIRELMSNETAQLMFDDGQPADSVASIQLRRFRLLFNSDDITRVGPHKMILRDCTPDNKLIEFSFDLNFKQN